MAIFTNTSCSNEFLRGVLKKKKRMLERHIVPYLLLSDYPSFDAIQSDLYCS